MFKEKILKKKAIENIYTSTKILTILTKIM
jgi:hypothetical protein